MEFKIIIKKLNKKLTPEEEIAFSKWYNESTIHRNFFNSVKTNYKVNLDDIDVEKAWLKIQNKLNKPKKNKVYWKYAAAIIVVGLGTVIYLLKDNFLSSPLNDPSVPVIVNNPILPGTDKATLTLEDGTVVQLDKNNPIQTHNAESNGEKIVYQKQTNEPSKIVYNFLTIPRGGQFYIVLSDGTKVWLNSESQLKYPVAFNKGMTREVELIYGEAYFDVTPSSENNGAKFKVINKSQEIEVLGTEFNLKAYPDDEAVYTTLVEGKVLVDNKVSVQRLLPSQQSILDKNNKDIKVTKVDVNRVVSWKNGIFSFRNETLKDIMKVISRWYDVNIVFENKDLETVKFKGILDKNQSIEEVLSIINSSSLDGYNIEGKTITLR